MNMFNKALTFAALIMSMFFLFLSVREGNLSLILGSGFFAILSGMLNIYFTVIYARVSE